VADATEAFFDELRRREHEPRLAHKKGTVHIELADNGRTDHWLVSFDDGRVDVSNEDGDADSTLRSDKTLFDRIVQGDANAVTAVMRGAVALEGDWNVLVLFQRLFPAPQ
jgi:putative sterol carrier protein